jgi:hypothetical protein
MDVSSASAAVGQQLLQLNTQAQMQAVSQQMQQELALIEAMAGAAPVLAAPPPGVGTVVDVSA